MQKAERPVIVVCGKGGVGKTALSALLARALLDAGVRPLLLIDADPVGGLGAAIGERGDKTLGAVRERVIAAARAAGEAERERLAASLDYMVLEALCERDDYSLLSMGHNTSKGCFCPVNKLLRSAIDQVVAPFAAVLIDAEAGIEQINREVTRRVTHVIAVTDGSARSVQAVQLIAELVPAGILSVVANRGETSALVELPEGAGVLGTVPEDPALREFDRLGRPLWELDPTTPARSAAAELARELGGPRPSSA